MRFEDLRAKDRTTSGENRFEVDVRQPEAPIKPKLTAVKMVADELEFDVRINSGQDTPPKLLFVGLKNALDRYKKEHAGEGMETEVWTKPPRAVTFTDKKGNQGMAALISQGLAAIDNGKNIKIFDLELGELNFGLQTDVASAKVPRGAAVGKELQTASENLVRLAVRETRENFDIREATTAAGKTKVDQIADRADRLFQASAKALNLAEKAGAEVVPQDVRRLLKEAGEEMERIGVSPRAAAAAARFREQELTHNLKTGHWKDGDENVDKAHKNIADLHIKAGEPAKAIPALNALHKSFSEGHKFTANDPRMGEVNAKLALAYASAQDTAKAEKALKQLSGIKPSDLLDGSTSLIAARELLAERFRKEGKLTAETDQRAALVEIARNLESHPRSAKLQTAIALGDLGEMHVRNGKEKEGGKVYAEAFAIVMKAVAPEGAIGFQLKEYQSRLDGVLNSYRRFLEKSGQKDKLAEIDETRKKLRARAED